MATYKSLWDLYMSLDHTRSRRPAQDAMVTLLKRRQNVVVAAPTGTGKTLAAILGRMQHVLDNYDDDNRPTLIIATSNKALQDQYVATLKDINEVFKAGRAKGIQAPRIKFHSVKGRGTYACIRKMKLADLNEHDWAEVERKQGVVPVDLNLNLREDESCARKNCPYYEECFYYRARRKVHDVRVVVTNHRMYLQHKLYPSAQMFPENHLVIFDECHELYDNLTSALELPFTLPKALRTARRELDRYLCSLDGAPTKTELWNELVEISSTHVLPILDEYRATRAEHRSKAEGHFSQEDEAGGCECFDINVEWEEALERFTDAIDRIKDPNYVVKFERTGKDSYALSLAPINVGGWAKTRIWDKNRYALISATPGTAEYIRRTIGASAAVESVGEAFDYSRTRLFVPSDGPTARGVSYNNPREINAYALSVWKYVEGMVTATSGGVLILATSRKHYEAIHKVVNRAVGRQRRVMMQGDRAVDEQLDIMRRQPGSILIGTKSLFTGIDLPRDALQLVVMTKTPFARKGDPLVEARTKEMQYYYASTLPAMLQVSQAFGRINRTVDDWGAFVLLDEGNSQLSWQSKSIPGMIPPKAVRVTSPEAIVDYMKQGPKERSADVHQSRGAARQAGAKRLRRGGRRAAQGTV